MRRTMSSLGIEEHLGLVCGAFGVVYLALTAAMGIGEAGAFVGKVRRRIRR